MATDMTTSKYHTAFFLHSFINYLHLLCSFNVYVVIICKKKKLKVKLSLCLTKHHTLKAYWGVKVQFHTFFDLGTR